MDIYDGFYLYDHPNTKAPVRSNGIAGWFYPTRLNFVDPDILVIHTAENIPDFNPPDTGAENIANYFTHNTRPASAHEVIDSDSIIPLLPDTAVAFHVRNYNTGGWGLEIATQAAKWDDVPDDYAYQLIDVAAQRTAIRVVKYDIPVVFRTKAEIDSGLKGITGHTNLDPDRRSDPGFTTSQWNLFLSLVNQYATDPEAHMAFLPIKYGDGMGTSEFKRSDVAVIQAMLNDVFNAKLTEDGQYGGKTREAVLLIPDAEESGKIVTGKMFTTLNRLSAIKALEPALGALTQDLAAHINNHPGSSTVTPHNHRASTSVGEVIVD